MGIFTQGKVPNEYLGFMNDHNIREEALTTVFRRLMERLERQGYTSGNYSAGLTSYESIPPGKLVEGMAHLLDTLDQEMCAGDKNKFRALHASTFSRDSLKADEKKLLKKLNLDDFMKLTEYLVVHATAQGLKTLMGDNMKAYVPQRNLDTLNRINRHLDAWFS